MQLPSPDLPFSKRETAVGAVEAWGWGVADVGDLRPGRALQRKADLGNTTAPHSCESSALLSPALPFCSRENMVRTKLSLEL